MSGSLFLDWAILSISLINVILTGWLGLTVLLNSERRGWGVWLIGCGMLAGTLFFVAHASIVGLGFQVAVSTLNFWWRIGWLPLIILPVSWYVSILWYVGYWEEAATGLVQRHRFWFRATIALSAVLILLVLLTSTLPTFSQNAQLQVGNSLSFFNIPLLFLLFPCCILLSIGLSIDALYHPAPSPRLLGDQSRRLARPWLIGAAWALLAVTLMVGAIIGWQLSTQSIDQLMSSVIEFTLPIAWSDLLISGLICGVVLMVGQAIVRYEIFTGKALPRGALRRHWLNVVVLATGFSMTVSLSLGVEQAPIYSILLAALLLTTFYALLNWRSYMHRDAYMAQLRPWVSSRQLHEQLLHSALPEVESTGFTSSTLNGSNQFTLLCEELLGAQRAYLGATGSLSAFVRAPLTYPQTNDSVPALFADLVNQFQSSSRFGMPAHSPSSIGIALNPDESDGYQWAIPLWSERGLNGIFLLGPKVDGSLYTQEDIEIARATGERLVDTRATSEIARSLVLLQRNRLVESHLADQQTRRVLHDDVLPQLHSLLIELSSQSLASPSTTDASTSKSLDQGSPQSNSPQADPASIDSALIGSATDALATIHQQISHLLHEMPIQAAPHIGQLGLVGALESVVSQEMIAAFDAIHWHIEPDVATVEERLRDSGLPLSAVEVIYYAAREAMRNAARHGRGGDEKRRLELTIRITMPDTGADTVADTVAGIGADTGAGSETDTVAGSETDTVAGSNTTHSKTNELTLVIEDTGVGIQHPNSSAAGASQGLALHSTMLAVLGGTMDIKSIRGAYTRVKIQLNCGSFTATHPIL